MPDIVGVRFKPCGKIYDFELNGTEVSKGDTVVVESELGLNLGTVVTERRIVEDHEKKLKKIIRRATEEDIIQKEENKKLEIDARDNCLERIMARGLPMKLISTEATLDKKRIIFYFTAEKRIDFRELVKDLAS
jgi:cell fate regulator YaaT (PSP1 superfamily)